MKFEFSKMIAWNPDLSEKSITRIKNNLFIISQNLKRKRDSGGEKATEIAAARLDEKPSPPL